MAVSKKKRQAVYDRLNGHCGYCGKPITMKQMQIDHMMPQSCRTLTADKVNGEWVFTTHELTNLMSSCRQCNHYKRDLTVEGFRHIMKSLHERLRAIYILKVGENFGMLEVKPFDGVFYFEKVNI